MGFSRGFCLTLCAGAFFAILSSSCKKFEKSDPILQRPLTNEEKKKREEVHKKSDDLYRQSAAERQKRLSDVDQGGGTLTIDTETLNLSQLSLILGSLP